jgi:hypothetical protein
MGRYLMKCEPDRDLYVEWSSVVDNLTWVGTRAEALHLEQTDEARLARTDLTGTSTLWKVEGHPVEGAWDDPTIHVMNTDRREDRIYSYTLRRSDLAAYAEAYQADDTARAEALLIPNRHCEICDWDTDVDPETFRCPKHAEAAHV